MNASGSERTKFADLALEQAAKATAGSIEENYHLRCAQIHATLALAEWTRLLMQRTGDQT